MATRKAAAPAPPSDRMFAELFGVTPSRAQRRKMQIVEAAIRCYATVGVEATSYDLLAKKCRVTRALVRHHFPDRQELFLLVARFIRLNFQQLAIAEIAAATSPVDALRRYVQSTFLWFERHPDHVRTWALFIYYSGIDASMRAVNTELVNVGHDRLTRLLEAGKAAGVFRVADVRQTSRLIQLLISGALVAAASEDLAGGAEPFAAGIVTAALDLAGGAGK